jgi:hypothetical protein
MMRCELCGGDVDLLTKACPCGRDPARDIAYAQAGLTRGKRLLWLGLAGTAIVIALLIAFDVKMSWVRWFFYRAEPGRLRIDPFKALLGVVPCLPLVALGSGARLVVKSYARLSTARRMQRLPRARVV